MKKDVAEILLRIEAVKVRPGKPFTFTSGMKSPIYIDNRLIISYPDERKKILSYFVELVKKNNLVFDVIAGVATAGIHWAAWLSAYFEKPMIYIRGKKKGHGRQNQIEGLLKKGIKVLVVEDHISTGGSSIDAVKAVRDKGGIVSHCVAISTYSFPKSIEGFKEINCRLHTLTDFNTLIETAAELDYIKDKEKVLEWNKDPDLWGTKYGG